MGFRTSVSWSSSLAWLSPFISLPSKTWFSLELTQLLLQTYFHSRLIASNLIFQFVF